MSVTNASSAIISEARPLRGLFFFSLVEPSQDPFLLGEVIFLVDSTWDDPQLKIY